MIWLSILFLALLPRAIAQFAIIRRPQLHGPILLVWAVVSLGVIPYVLFPALREVILFPPAADAVYFGLFILLAIHFEWKFGPKPKADDEKND